MSKKTTSMCRTAPSAKLSGCFGPNSFPIYQTMSKKTTSMRRTAPSAKLSRCFGPNSFPIYQTMSKKDYVDAQEDTISEAFREFRAQLVSDLSDYVKKDYVDAQDGLRVLKAGDTMSGDLTMAQGLVRGLPMNMNKRLEGDEAVSKYQVVEIISEALRHFWARVGPDLSEYAKKDYVDEQLALRVLKAGGTMKGDLDMGARGRVRGLPTSKVGPRLEGDEEVSQFETVDIISEALKYFKAQIVSDLSEYAKKDYVDAQDALRVLKAGDTMTGDLDMGGRLVRGLLKDLREYKGDEATSWNQVEKTMATHKPVITVWAEQNGPLTAGEREWSFGDGATGTTLRKGYTMMAPGRILRAGLAVATNNPSLLPAASVLILVNGIPTQYGVIMKTNVSHSVSIRYLNPLEVNRTQVIGLKTLTSSPEVKSATVSLLIELDL